MGLMKAKAKKYRRLREVKSAAEAEIENIRSENLHLTESAEALQGNVAEAELTMKKLKKELNVTKQQLKSTEMSAADSATALRSEHE
jgi:peptidoglycan hydrolase CwlO-like protein